jgi:CheY-like chemotaxis protein
MKERLSVDTVLIIETDSETIATLSDLLSSHGYLADAVDDIEAARQKVASHSPKLVVIGPQLGKSTGFLACSLIKKTPQAKGIPCVLLYTEREEGQVQRHQGLAGRAEVYLRKPFTLDEFKESVADYLTLTGGEKAAAESEVVVEEEVVEAPSGTGDVVEEVLEAPPSGVSPEMEAELARTKGDLSRAQRELEQAQKEAKDARDEAKKAREAAKAAKDVPPETVAEAEKLRGEVARLEKQLELAQKQA